MADLAEKQAVEEPTLEKYVPEDEEFAEQLNELGVEIYPASDGLSAYMKLAKPVPAEKLEPLIEKAGIINGVNHEILRNRSEVWRRIIQKKLIPIAKITILSTPLYDIDFQQHADEILPFLEHRYTSDQQLTADKQLPLLNFREKSIFGKRLDPNDLQKSAQQRDIYGELRDEFKRRIVFFTLGKGLSETPTGDITVMVSGYLEFTGERLTVKDKFVIEDVDDWTGKTLKFFGTVEVAQNVIEHFDIEADKDIRILGSTETSDLTAGGKIDVQEGIIGQGEAQIRCQDVLKAKYINQANVTCAQDVELLSGAFHSKIICHGKLLMEKGPIVGGFTWASYGIEARFIGAVGGTRTVVAAGFNTDIPLSLDRAAAEFKNKQEKLNALSMKVKEFLSKPEVMAKFSPQEKKTFAELHDKMKGMKRRLDELKRWLDAHDFDAARLAKIQVRGKVFPNTIIKLHYQTYEVTDEMSRVTFIIDPETHEVKPVPMRLR